MPRSKLRSWDAWVLGALIALYPSAVWSISSAGSVIFQLLGIGGLLVLIVSHRWPCDRDETRCALALALFVVATAAAWSIHGFESSDYQLLRRHLLFLVAVLALIWLAWRRPASSWFWWGIVTSSYLVGLMGIILLCKFNSFRNGIVEYTQANPIFFGQISTLVALLSAVAMGYFYRRRPGLAFVPLVGASLAMVASIGSQTRGAWIALPVLLALLLWNARRVLLRRVGITALGLLVSLGLLTTLPDWELVERRAARAVADVQAFASEDQARTESSANVRLQLWTAGLEAWAENPVIGAGKDGYFRYLRQGVEEGRLHPVAAKYLIAHNQYVASLAYYGLLGGIVLLGVFVVPGAVFFRRWRSAATREGRELGLAGLVVVIAFAHYGLTDSVFEQRSTIIMYSLMTVALLAIRSRGQILSEENVVEQLDVRR
jgi:O-antigen ligase